MRNSYPILLLLLFPLLVPAGLTGKPLSIGFNAFPGIEYELVMYADNLGTIPPNTALMVVRAGAKQMETFLSSGYDKSASVRFIYQPAEKKPDDPLHAPHL